MVDIVVGFRIFDISIILLCQLVSLAPPYVVIKWASHTTPITMPTTNKPIPNSHLSVTAW